MKRVGSTTQTVTVPLCADCRRTLDRRSGEEERRARLGQALAGGAAFAAGALGAALVPGGWVLKLAVGLVLAVVAGAVVLRTARPWAEAAALPEAQAIRSAARLVDFTWRGLTLEFARDDFAGRVRDLNADLAAEPARPAPAEG